VITMTDEKIKQLEARIEELETKCEELEAELEDMNGDITSNHKMARAICELQEELRRKFPDLYLINTIKAPTMVGME
jgi:predicted RNase H-like nuclease (RuvC/YqgF family)